MRHCTVQQRLRLAETMHARSEEATDCDRRGYVLSYLGHLGVCTANHGQHHQAIAQAQGEYGHFTDTNLLSAGAKLAKSLILLVPQEGFEPPTPSLRMTCSTG